MFCLYYDAQTQKISALNGSGRAGGKCTLETIRAALGLADGASGKIPMSSVHAVTVPGAAAGWCDTVDRFGSGKLTMEQILAPAIELGEKGFPVSELVAHYVRCEFTIPSMPSLPAPSLSVKSLTNGPPCSVISGPRLSPRFAPPRPTSARCLRTT